MELDPGQIGVIGTELHYVTSESEEYQQEGQIDNSISLTKDFGIVEGYLCYRDENDDVRKLDYYVQSDKIDNAGNIWISEFLPTIMYIDEEGVWKTVSYLD